MYGCYVWTFLNYLHWVQNVCFWVELLSLSHSMLFPFELHVWPFVWGCVILLCEAYATCPSCFLPSEACSTDVDLLIFWPWITDDINILWDAITHPRPNYNIGLNNLPMDEKNKSHFLRGFNILAMPSLFLWIDKIDNDYFGLITTVIQEKPWIDSPSIPCNVCIEAWAIKSLGQWLLQSRHTMKDMDTSLLD